MNEIEKIKDEIINTYTKRVRAIEHEQYAKAAESRAEGKRLIEILEKPERRNHIIDNILDE